MYYVGIIMVISMYVCIYVCMYIFTNQCVMVSGVCCSDPVAGLHCTHCQSLTYTD